MVEGVTVLEGVLLRWLADCHESADAWEDVLAVCATARDIKSVEDLRAVPELGALATLAGLDASRESDEGTGSFTAADIGAVLAGMSRALHALEPAQDVAEPVLPSAAVREPGLPLADDEDAPAW
jgi:hypothetical protein